MSDILFVKFYACLDLKSAPPGFAWEDALWVLFKSCLSGQFGLRYLLESCLVKVLGTLFFPLGPSLKITADSEDFTHLSSSKPDP